ncbi:SusC/RagA family TonB-linked outer membrane protein [Marinigracilibium pacificum]|uniref:SusC/RagA family TonB-linked outer membrane protein n=1 Tax=Marinigracilibium pacificum TaxID=2729599 RepID=A0A848J4S1_9BACT|nr:SusC/RagA family TonB-linked outer membrane protein [Marinigracilibium pacificum]NMM49349.1 SusC/RagA family TonB-linked outer membrane protein [Marinigracilibium pacificum]
MKRIFLLSFFCVLGFIAQAQEKSVSGTVTGENGEGIPGVNVLVKGTTLGVVTDIQGNYSLQVPSGEAVLQYSSIGYLTQEISVAGKSSIDVVLLEDVQQLTEVVVTALGVSRDKRAVGSAVQNVAGEALAETKETNIVNSLQGQVAGVQIQGTQGALGGSSRITIRGVNSFLGENQPLFVVDGMPINNDNYATTAQQRGFGGGAYDYGNAAADINPQDIESVTVLKGASATALYGTRGSNGVILITTKSGAKSKGIGVAVNSSWTFEKPLALIEYQQEYGGGAISPTGSGFVEFTEQINGQSVDFLAPIYSKDGSWGPKYDPNTMVRHWDSWDPQSANYGETRPWTAPANDYSEFFETGLTATNSVAFSGGNDNGTFRVSYTNLNQDGITPVSNLQRNTVAFNVSYNLSEKLTVSSAGNFVNQAANGRNATGYDNKNPMQAFTQWWQTQLDVKRLEDNYTWKDGRQYTWNATGPIIDGSGNLVGFEPAPYFFDNPYWLRNNILQEDSRDRFFGNVNLNYEIVDGLSVNLKAMRDGFTFRAQEGLPNGSVDQAYYSETQRTFFENNYEAKLLYEKTFGSDFSLNAMAGGNIMRQGATRVTVQTNGGLVIPGWFNIDNSVDAPIPSTYESKQGINSLFATASLGYKSMLFLDLGLRSDWASTLPEDENQYYYPSASLAFVFTELGSLQNSDLISFGKVRASFGQTANAPNPFALSPIFDSVQPAIGTPRFTVPNQNANPFLGPEKTDEVEFGLEMAFFKNRLSFDVTYYDKTTRDQIFTVPTSATTGYTSQYINGGSMRNSGFEVMLRGTPVQTEDFSWDMSLNFATYNNEVVELAPGVESIILGTTWAGDVRVEKGYPYMAFFGNDFVRNDKGEVVVGANGLPSNAGRTYFGSAVADFTGGFRNTFSYKGLSLTGLIDFQGGGVIHSTSLQWAKYSGMHPETAADGIRENGLIVDGVYLDGTPNTTPVDPQTYYQTFYNIATPNVYDASFVKLREVRLSYTLPKSVLGNLPFRDVTFGVLGRNLAILYSDLPYLDPQGVNGAGNLQGLENAQVPTTRSLGFDLSFKF